MRFMLLMIPDVYKRDTPPGFAPPAEAIAEMGKFNQAMIDAGVMLSGDGLFPPRKAQRVSFRGGKPVVTDGPFAETKEHLLGFYLVDCASLDDAIEAAKDLGRANPGGSYEVRPVAVYHPGTAEAVAGHR